MMLLTILVLFLIPRSYTQETNEIRTFYHHDEAGLIVDVEAPADTEPGQEINVSVSLHCYAANLSVSYLYVTIFDFESGEKKIPIETIKHVERGIGYKPKFNETYAQTYEIKVPEDVWDITYGEVSCQWNFGGHTFFIREDGFTMTYVRNIKMENLKEQLANKTQEYNTLWENYTQLNQTYWELNQTYWELNQTYWNLKTNQTSEDNTRFAMIIFIITTVFFAATTLYLMAKKPKEYW